MKLCVCSKGGKELFAAAGQDRIDVVYPERYRKGDVVALTVDTPGFYEVCFEDTMPPALLYIHEKAIFVIPFGRMERIGYSPRSFKGPQHLLSAHKARTAQIEARRNLALNPYDQHETGSSFPHASASTETRGEALFAARNAIDGVFANTAHYPWPFQSWGINKDPNAALTIAFGVPVTLDEIVLTLRADYPHDSHWTGATIEFSDGSRERLALKKATTPQAFPIAPRTVSFLTLKELTKAEDESPYPALTQIEAWGIVAKENEHGSV